MFDQTMGLYNFAWYGMACIALWLLYRIFQIVKSIHFMIGKWFDRDYIKPFEQERGIYADD